MSRPPKPVIILENEKRSHRTKAELEQRAAAESKSLSRVRMREFPSVRADPVAHKEFKRIQALLRKIDKDDDLYGGVINRYCQLKSECLQMEEKREAFYEAVGKLDARFYDSENGGGLDETEFYSLQIKLQKAVIDCDKQVQAKRRMMLDIEKENVMTVASSLRAIPKNVQEDDGEDDPLIAIMQTQAEARRRIMVDSG